MIRAAPSPGAARDLAATTPGGLAAPATSPVPFDIPLALESSSRSLDLRKVPLPAATGRQSWLGGSAPQMFWGWERRAPTRP